MQNAWLLVVVSALIAGCGLTQTGAAAANGGTVEAQQAAGARRTEERVRAQVETANQEAAERARAAVDAATR